MKKTLAKIILGITIFLGAIICSQNVSKASNLDLFKGQYSENEIFEISPNSNYDLADEIRKVSRGIDGKLLIHIPSGTYTINNASTIERKDWYSNYSSIKNKYVCKNAVNDTCSELWYTTSTSNTSMFYVKSTDVYYFSKGFAWDGSKYVLDNNTSTSLWDINDKSRINSAHYTCWNETGECENISYIYYADGTTLFYINITNGKSEEDAVNEMLYNNDVNRINSVMKTGVDAWYKQYLSDYSDYLEDTVFCNDRSQINSSLNGWNPNGGSVSDIMYFKGYNVTSDLKCTNITDQFSVSNNDAKLTYKVGLMSSPEMNILNNIVRKTGQTYWLFSPYEFSVNAGYGRGILTNGNFTYNSISIVNGVRPVTSLIPGTCYSDGDGSMEHPYIID